VKRTASSRGDKAGSSRASCTIRYRPECGSRRDPAGASDRPKPLARRFDRDRTSDRTWRKAFGHVSLPRACKRAWRIAWDVPTEAMYVRVPTCARRSPARAAVRVARRQGGNKGLVRRTPQLTYSGANWVEWKKLRARPNYRVLVRGHPSRHGFGMLLERRLSRIAHCTIKLAQLPVSAIARAGNGWAILGKSRNRLFRDLLPPINLSNALNYLHYFRTTGMVPHYFPHPAEKKTATARVGQP
jgi:hypothetical protein